MGPIDWSSSTMMAANPSVLIVCSLFIQVAPDYLFGPGQVTGSLGGSVIVPCYYSPISANIHGRKFWCKMRGSQCNTIVSTSPYVQPNYMNRTYLQDFRDHFVVSMTSLQYADAGAYRCGIGNINKMHYYPVSMTISEGKYIPSSSEVYIGKLRGSLDIHCPAPRMLSNGSLYWCKVRNTKSASCDTIINNSGQVNSRVWGRVLIQEERNKTGFTVLVNKLEETDSGFYRCGVSSHTNESIWKDVWVHIMNYPTMKKVLKPLTAGGSLQVKCQVPKDFGTRTLTYWCKWSPAGCPPLVDSNGFVREGLEGRISFIPDNSTVGTYTVIMKHLEVEDSGSYWCITSNGSRVESSSIKVDVLALTTKAYTSSPDVTGIGTHSADLLPTTEISTIQSSSTDSVTVPPIYTYSSSGPPSSRVTLQDTTAVLYSQSSTRGQSSTAFSMVPSNPLGSTDSRQDTTAMLYSQSSTRGKSSTEFSTVPSNPLTSTDSRQDTTAALYSQSSTRGQASTEFSTVPSNPLSSTDTRQDITEAFYSQSSTRGQTSTEFITVPSNPLSSTDSRQDSTVALYSQLSTRGQSSTEFSTVPSNPRSSTDSRQEIGTIQSRGTDSVIVPPIYNHSSSAPPSSRVTLQDTTAVLYSQSSTRGQTSTEFGTVPSNPRSSTDSRRAANPSRSSGTHAAHRSGRTTTLASRHTSGTTQRTGNATLYSQAVSGKNESGSESLVFRRRNLLLIIIPVVVIACCIIIGALVAVLVKVHINNAANDPTANQEHIAMIDKEAELEDAQHNDSNVLKLDNPEALCGTSDV